MRGFLHAREFKCAKGSCLMSGSTTGNAGTTRCIGADRYGEGGSILEAGLLHKRRDVIGDCRIFLWACGYLKANKAPETTNGG